MAENQEGINEPAPPKEVVIPRIHYLGEVAQHISGADKQGGILSRDSQDYQETISKYPNMAKFAAENYIVSRGYGFATGTNTKIDEPLRFLVAPEKYGLVLYGANDDGKPISMGISISSGDFYLSNLNNPKKATKALQSMIKYGISKDADQNLNMAIIGSSNQLSQAGEFTLKALLDFNNELSNNQPIFIPAEPPQKVGNRKQYSDVYREVWFDTQSGNLLTIKDVKDHDQFSTEMKKRYNKALVKAKKKPVIDNEEIEQQKGQFEIFLANDLDNIGQKYGKEYIDYINNSNKESASEPKGEGGGAETSTEDKYFFMEPNETAVIMFGLSGLHEPLSQIYRFKTDKMAHDITHKQPSIMHEYALLHQMLMFSEDFPDDLRFAVIMSQDSKNDDMNKIVEFLQYVTSKTTSRDLSIVKPKEHPEEIHPGENDGLVLMDNKHRRLIIVANGQLEIAKNQTPAEANPLQIDSPEKAA